MEELEQLKANQAATIELIGKVKVDVEGLHADLSNIPVAGMTPEQKAAVTEAVATSAAINESLAGVDALTADKTATPTPEPDPVPTPNP